MEFLPDEIANFIQKLGKDLDSALPHIENENIPKTNNWLEIFFKIVFPKKYKHIGLCNKFCGIVHFYHKMIQLLSSNFSS